jgi:hypothetical protein
MADPRMGIGTAQNFSHQHSRKENVRNVLRGAGYLVEPFDALYAFTYYRKLFCFGHLYYSGKLLSDFSRQGAKAQSMIIF